MRFPRHRAAKRGLNLSEEPVPSAGGRRSGPGARTFFSGRSSSRLRSLGPSGAARDSTQKVGAMLWAARSRGPRLVRDCHAK